MVQDYGYFYCHIASLVGRVVMCRTASQLPICPQPSRRTGLARINLIWRLDWMLHRSHEPVQAASGTGIWWFPLVPRARVEGLA
jgi:hypothetical protein